MFICLLSEFSSANLFANGCKWCSLISALLHHDGVAQFLSWLPEWIILGLYCPLASALLCCDGVALFLSGLPK